LQLVGGDRVVWIPGESNSAHIGTRDTLDNPEKACTPAEMCRRIGVPSGGYSRNQGRIDDAAAFRFGQASVAAR